MRYVTNENDWPEKEEQIKPGKKPILCNRTKTMTGGKVREVNVYPMIVCNREERRRLNIRTPEQMQKQNEMNRLRTVERLIYTNFDTNDYFITLTNKDIIDKAELDRRLHNYITSLRHEAKKMNLHLRYIYV